MREYNYLFPSSSKRLAYGVSMQAPILVKDVGRRMAEVSKEPCSIRRSYSSAPVDHCSALKRCLYFSYFVFSGKWQLEAGIVELDNNFKYIEIAC